MRIIIGGSSSTGSSLLQTILNRHPKIFCGPETSLFAKPQLYQNWKNFKSRITQTKIKALRNPGWFMFNGTRVLHPEFGWQKTKLENEIQKCQTFQEFADAFFQPAMKRHNKSMWIEKTPTNALCFDYFLAEFENSRVIHTIRNPYDAIASIVSRGNSVYFSVGLYLYNVAFGMRTADSLKHNNIKYEDLVSEPEKQIKQLMNWMDLKFYDDQLAASGLNMKMDETMEGWTQKVTNEISTKSIGRFDNLSQNVQNQIIDLSHQLKFKRSWIERFDLKVNAISDVCELFDYQYYNRIYNNKNFKVEKLKDMLSRDLRNYPLNSRNYPFELAE